MKAALKILSLLLAIAVGTDKVAAQRMEHGHSVVILDEDLPYIDMLLMGIKPGSKKVYLDKSLPAIVSIDKIIRENAPISSLHILTHGKAGALVFSLEEINTAMIEENEFLLETWKQYFVHHGDIILYGSEIGKGGAGLTFVTTLAVLTGLDVAASKDLTGATLKHGDWLMEVRSGYIESTLIVSKQIRAAYPGVLNPMLNKGLLSTIFRWP